MTISSPSSASPSAPTHLDAGELRWLVIRLMIGGPDAWRHDPEAADLLRFAIERYRDLAHRHHLPAEDAAVAAFEVLRTRTVLKAKDPWGVVTRAVQTALITEEVAQGLLCSTRRAKEPDAHRDAKAARVGAYETPIWEFHPSLRVPSVHDLIDATPDEEQRVNAFHAADDVVSVFVFHGWPPHTARAGVEYICSRLTKMGDRDRAYECLRREPQAKALLDIDQPTWLTMLRVVLGNRDPDRRHTAEGRGLLLRRCLDEPVEDLVHDETVATALVAAAPWVRTGSSDA
jgi:hypothetical protein